MGDDEALSTNELIAVICEAMGNKAHIWRLPKGLMNGIAKLGGWLHLPPQPAPYAETHRKLFRQQRQDKSRPRHHPNAGEGKGWADGDYKEFWGIGYPLKNKNLIKVYIWLRVVNTFFLT